MKVNELVDIQRNKLQLRGHYRQNGEGLKTTVCSVCRYAR